MGDNVHNLSTIVRQSDGNPLIDIITKARNDVKNNGHSLINALSKGNGIYDTDLERGFVITRGSHFSELLNDRFGSSEFERDIDYCRYTAFTNKSVLDVNSFIRKNVVGDYPQILVQDDVLTSYSTVLDEFNNPIIVNSEDYIIDEIMDYNNKFIIQGYLITLRSVSTGNLTSKLFVVDHRNPDAVNRYVSIFSTLLSKAKGSKNPMTRREEWKAFYDFKNYNLLMSDIYTGSGALFSTKDLDYAFGLTVHKTQGSTFDNIFVNANDIIYNKYGVPYSDVNLRNRLLYVALSRAKNGAFILL